MRGRRKSYSDDDYDGPRDYDRYQRYNRYGDPL